MKSHEKTKKSSKVHKIGKPYVCFSFSSLFNFACRAIQKAMWNYVHAMATFLSREKNQKSSKQDEKCPHS
jgi:hypothetical protein